MSGVTAAVEPRQEGKAFFFNGNLSALALSSAIKALGGFVGVYLPLYFVQIGGSASGLICNREQIKKQKMTGAGGLEVYDKKTSAKKICLI